MKTWRIAAGGGIDGLKLVDEASPEPGPRQVKVRVRATSINFRDLLVLKGFYPVSTTDPLVPGSDAAGDVIATGTAVRRFKPGDKVATSFFPNWIEGRVAPQKIAGALGGGGAGTFAEEIVLDEDALVRAPSHLDYTQATTLTCAGTTAWNALFVQGALRPGSTVLLLGTGGVSIWALQLAKAAGARVIITSSSDEKLAQAKALGADAGINYRTHPAWSGEVRRLTEGAGAEIVLEVGGEKTIEQSIASVQMGGTVVIIGAVSGMGGAIVPRSLIGASIRVQGVYVGSRQMHEDLARFVEAAHITPAVGRVFGFGEAPEAFRHFEAGKHFGKVALKVG
jgi:NADPH:quinone reductase-like Zn-dependent oxidoreductase